LRSNTADAVRDLGIEPRVAMLSFSNFGSTVNEPSPRRVAEATAIVRRLRPELMSTARCRPTFALLPGLREDWSFST